jgi:hypothetical protein
MHCFCVVVFKKDRAFGGVLAKFKPRTLSGPAMVPWMCTDFSNDGIVLTVKPDNVGTRNPFLTSLAVHCSIIVNRAERYEKDSRGF